MAKVLHYDLEISEFEHECCCNIMAEGFRFIYLAFEFS